jgi:hypothetical protein
MPQGGGSYGKAALPIVPATSHVRLQRVREVHGGDGELAEKAFEGELCLCRCSPSEVWRPAQCTRGQKCADPFHNTDFASSDSRLPKHADHEGRLSTADGR